MSRVAEAVGRSHTPAGRWILSEVDSNVGDALPGLRDATREYLDRHQPALRESILAGAGGIDAAQEHAKIMDGLLTSLFCASHTTAGFPLNGADNRVALVGVGGIGRGLVGVHSDIDLLFLCDNPGDPRVQELVTAMLYPLWDVGLDVGQVVRGVDETVELALQDLRTATTLVDLRRITGDQAIVDELRSEARRRLFEPGLTQFLDELILDVSARHAHYGNSLFLLEPEVKLGRGGLRDADIGRWAARARWRTASFADLVRCGALLPSEAEAFSKAREALWRLRNLLHLSAGRRHDRLTFADQEELALQLGFADGVQLAVEQFMQSYYRHARVIAQTSSRLVARARPKVRRTRAKQKPLGDGLMIFDGQVTFCDSEDIDTDPEIVLRIYEAALDEGCVVYPFARDMIAQATERESWCDRFRKTPGVPRRFFRLLTHAAQTSLPDDSIVGELHELGLIMALIPEFGAAVGRVQHDVYNVYTVDAHSVLAVDALRRLERGADAGKWPTASRVAAEAPRPEPLYLACLLHEVGKGLGPDYRHESAIIAREVGKRLGFTDVDADQVEFLVRNQIALYRVATQRDIHDPQVLSEVASLAGTVERLRDLYLFSFVDLCATNPKAMTLWKARLLEEIGNLAARMLEGVTPDHSASRVRALRREVRIAFVGDENQEALECFLEDMPSRYILANDVTVIREHAQAAVSRGSAGEIVRDVTLAGAGFAELIVVAEDRPGLLADVSAALARHRLSVVGAQIYTRPTRPLEAVDVFQVRSSQGGEYLAPTTLAAVESDLCALREGRISAASLIAQASGSRWSVRSGPAVSTEVIIDNHAAPAATVIDIYTHDRPGVLCLLAQTFRDAGVRIEVARVNTEGLRVVDVFYVTDANGHKIEDPERLSALRAELLRVLEAP